MTTGTDFAEALSGALVDPDGPWAAVHNMAAQLSASEASELAATMATSAATDAQLAAGLRRMLVGGAPSEGTVRLVSAVFGKLGDARRYGALLACSEALLMPAIAALYSAQPAPVVPLLAQLLHGYQHSPLLFAQARAPLMAAARHLKEGADRGDVETFRLLKAVAELLHCEAYQHAGHPELVRPVEALLRDELAVEPPSAPDVQRRLREAGWGYVSKENLPAQLPWVEGRFRVSETHSPAQTTLSLTAAGGAHGYEATLAVKPQQQQGGQTERAASARLFYVSKGGAPDTAPAGAAWHLAGQWAAGAAPPALVPDKAAASSENRVAADWECSGCTVRNAGSADKCSVCGAKAPPPTYTAANPAANPAPFALTLTAAGGFRGEAARGDTVRRWLGTRVPTRDGFALSGGAATAVPLPAVRFDGAVGVDTGARFSRDDAPTITLECWACGGPGVLLSNGDYTLEVTAAGELQLGVGGVTLAAPMPADASRLAHVVAAFGPDGSMLLVDGAPAAAGAAPAAALLPARAQRLLIGAAAGAELPLTGADGARATFVPRFAPARAFSGSLREVRVWSGAREAPAIAAQARGALAGDEDGLLGYWPLAGAEDALLLDRSPAGAHGVPVPAIDADTPATTGAVGAGAPAGHFRAAIGDDWRLAGPAAPAGSSGVALGEGGALFCAARVAVRAGFTSVLALAPASATLFVVDGASYWSLRPQAAAWASSAALPGSRLVLRLQTDAAGACVAAEAWLHRDAQARRVVGRALSLGGGGGGAITVEYAAAESVLRVSAGGAPLCEFAVNLAAALSLRRRHAWVGLVGASPSAAALTWTFDGPGAEDADWAQRACATCGADSGDALEAPSCCVSAAGAGAEEAKDSFAADFYAAAGSTEWACGQCTVRNPNANTKCSVCGADAPPGLAAAGSAPPTGDWPCPTCTVVNDEAASKCSVCETARPAAAAAAAAAAAPAPAPAAAAEAKGGDWECGACTTRNPSARTLCSACETPRPASAPAPAPAAAAKAEDKAWADWNCKVCSLRNAPSKATCSACGSPKPAADAASGAKPEAKPGGAAAAAASKWNCHVCGTPNTPASKRCIMCQAFKRADEGAAESKADWTCVCTVKNPAARPACSVCGTSKARAQAEAPKPTKEEKEMNEKEEAAKKAEAERKEAEKKAEEERVAALTDLRQRLTAFKRRGWTDAPAPAGVAADDWDTTLGHVALGLGEAFHGFALRGAFGAEAVTALGTLVPADGTYALAGEWRSTGFSGSLSATAEKVSLTWFRGESSGVSEGARIADADEFRGVKEDQPSASGLVNMDQSLVNVCYQNSLLQSLFMTDALREALLSLPLADADPALAREEPAASTAAIDEARLTALDGQSASASRLFAAVQWLFARLALSQRPSTTTHALQLALPMTFPAGQQQDTTDFANWVMDQLAEGFAGTARPDAMRELLFGEQAEVMGCKNCHHQTCQRESFWELMLNMTDLRYTAITDIRVVAGPRMDLPVPDGYERINADLNSKRERAPYTFLCVGRDPAASRPITDILIKTVAEGAAKPTQAGYERLDTNLNMGGNTLGNQVYLFFMRDPRGSPITDLQVVLSDDPREVPDGFRKIKVDLNQGRGDKVFLCYRQDMPIRDVRVGPNGERGYKFVDASLTPAGGEDLFLMHTDGGDGPGVTDLELVPAADGDPAREAALARGLRPVGPPLPGAGQLMARAGEGNPLYAIDVFRAPRRVPRYEGYETLQVAGADVQDVAGAWVADENTVRERRNVRLETAAAAASAGPVFEVAGSYTGRGGGDIRGVLFPGGDGMWELRGTWQDPSVKKRQQLQLRLSDAPLPSAADARGALIGLPDAKTKRPTALLFHARHTSTQPRAVGRITALAVLRGDEPVPEGFERLNKTVGNCDADLNAGSGEPTPLYLAFKRGGDEPPIKDVAVFFENLEPAPPEGFEPVPVSTNPPSAGTNVFLCVRRLTPEEATDPAAHALTDVALMWADKGDRVPAGFRKLGHTPVGVEANLNTGLPGHEIFLLTRSGPAPPQPVEHPALGQFESVTESKSAADFGRVELHATRLVADAVRVTGRFDYDKGEIDGWLLPKASGTGFELLAQWKDAKRTVPAPCRFDVSQDLASMTGEWTDGNDSGVWELVKDSYVQVAFKKDYTALWANGELRSTQRVSALDVDSMVRSTLSPRSLGVDNMRDCGGCNERCDFETRTVVVTPPRHLVLTLKRMWFDPKTTKTQKCLQDVDFPVVLSLPDVPAELADIVGGSGGGAGSRRYGVYAVVIHAGLRASAGHYYCFARRSASRNLDQPDAEDAPWIKFNDTRVTASSWAQMRAELKQSVPDNAYLLFYKQLPATEQPRLERLTSEKVRSRANSGSAAAPPPDSPAGDDDAALARAIALSMGGGGESPAAAEAAEAAGAGGKEAEAEPEPEPAAEAAEWTLDIIRENREFLSKLQTTYSPLCAEEHRQLAAMDAGDIAGTGLEVIMGAMPDGAANDAAFAQPLCAGCGRVGLADGHDGCAGAGLVPEGLLGLLQS